LNKKRKNTENIVLHDIFDIKGGGERLALSIAETLKADLGYGKKSPNSFDLEAMHAYEKIDLGLKIEFSGLKTYNLSKLFTYNTKFLNQYENVVYSGIICPLAVRNHLNGGNFYYCHTPPRFVYDKYQHYMNQFMLPQQLLLKMLAAWLKPRYEASVALMDVVFTNSKFVKARVKEYLNRDSIVIYPPCNLEKFYFKKPQNYYLSTARFDELKRVDKIIEAFKKMPDKELLLCSSGSEGTKLRKLAKDVKNITFVGQVSDEKLQQLISECIATIYIPKDEDFGMSPVESMAAGKPVICSDHGGPIESIVDGETGFYMSDENLVENIMDCVSKLDVNKATQMKNACEQRATLFSEENFHKNIRRYVVG
jgi:glycosyltransferase involved in cell wall biosynthesis